MSMLARTAAQLYWLGRYVERMDYLARLIDTASRMSVMPAPSTTDEWQSAIIAAGCEPAFFERYSRAERESAIDFLARDPENPSSIMSSLKAARSNARAVRAAITSDMWDAINATYLEARKLTPADFSEDNLPSLLDWFKREALLFDGASDHTMMREMAFDFVRLGRYLERADNTARILDVKYHLLLPTYEQVGGSVDYYQWSAILRAVSARRAYHVVYQDRIKPINLAQLLIIRAELPRSLCYCYSEVVQILDDLARMHGHAGECHRLAGATYARLRYGQIDEIFKYGLHEFLTDMVDTTADLSDEVAKLYLT